MKIRIVISYVFACNKNKALQLQYPGTSVASCERSFSKLKLVKTYLRSQMSDARLSGLAVLSIERELAEELNFHDVGLLIKDFATRKARKVHV